MTRLVKKNERYQLKIEDLSHDGSGVGKIEGYPLFIPHVLPGEKVDVQVTKANKKYGFAQLTHLEEAAAERREPPCPVFWTCGGCQLQHLSYEGQLIQKRKTVRDVMDRIGKLPHVPVHPVIGMEHPWRYRNKSQIPFSEQEGKTVAGFYQTRSHHIVDTDACLIQSEEADALMVAIKEKLRSIGIHAYDEKSHRGILRHLVIRKAAATGEVMVVFVTRTKDIPQLNELVAIVKETIPHVTSIMQNVNPKRTNVIFGEETILLEGAPVIVDTIGEIKFEISARSFYQINPKQTEVLYQQALKYAQLTGEERVIDAYCGIGTISLFLAKQAKAVYGVEIVPEAIADAKRNAQINGLDNAFFEVGPAEEVIPRWYKEGKAFDVLMVDPPRKGCDEKLLQTILTYRPNRIVYVSCNPATLARDLRILEDGGYQTKEVQPVDMFPHSSHVEVVCYLELRE